MKAAGGWPILVLRRDQESMPRHIDICKTFERISGSLWAIFSTDSLFVLLLMKLKELILLISCWKPQSWFHSGKLFSRSISAIIMLKFWFKFPHLALLSCNDKKRQHFCQAMLSSLFNCNPFIYYSVQSESMPPLLQGKDKVNTITAQSQNRCKLTIIYGGGC